MTAVPPIRPRLAVLGAAALLVLSGLPGALAQDAAAPAYGTLRDEDGGRRLIVPALWAGRKSDGTMVGGMEAAEVWVGSGRELGYSVDLASIEAQGAGPSWTAASASAATVATLVAGADPALLDVTFAITGPIDGPSAGGVLTAGILAAQMGVPFLPGVTMTGTISPDGTIGVVGGVPTKIASAKAAGFTTVVIPADNREGFPDGAESPVDLVAWGAEQGMTVVPVTSLAEAFRTLTGREMVPPAERAYTMSAASRLAGRHTSVGLLERVEDLRFSLSAAGAALPDGIDAEIEKARANLEMGSVETAYGLAVDALTRLARVDGEARVRARIAEGGLEAARADLAAWIAELETSAARLIGLYGDVSGLGLAQQVSIPAALGWVAYPEAVLHGVGPIVPTLADEASLLALGALVGEQAASIEWLFPDAVTAVLAMDDTPEADPAEVVAFLSGYTDFLERAGDANMDYVDALVRGSLAEVLPPDDLAPLERAALAMRDLVAQGSERDDPTVPGRIARLSRALSYWVITGALVADAQTLGTDGFALGEDAIVGEDTAGLRASIDVAALTVAETAARLQAAGIDPGYSVWSMGWGTAIHSQLKGTEREGTGGVIALNELWYDVVVVQMLNAARGLVR